MNIAREFKHNPLFNVRLSIEFKSHHKKPFFEYQKRKYYENGENFYLAPNKSYQNSNIWYKNSYPIYKNNNYSFLNPFNTIRKPLFRRL